MATSHVERRSRRQPSRGVILLAALCLLTGLFLTPLTILAASDAPPGLASPVTTELPAADAEASAVPTSTSPPVPTATDTPLFEASAQPSLTLGGSTESIVVDARAIVRVTTDANATIVLWPMATCTGQGHDTRLSTFEIGASVPGINAFQAVWKDGSAGRSACLTITWAVATPTPVVPPSLTLDGNRTSIVVPAKASVRVATEANASITLWTSNGCDGPGANTGLSSVEISSSAPGTNYFRASLRDDPSIQSACLSITWANPSPTPTETPTATSTATPTGTSVDATPPLTLNGGTVSITVPSQGIVHVLTDPNATLWFWSGSDCAGGSVNLNTHESYAAPQREAQWSYQASWIDNPGLHSACLTITFTDGPPTATPSPTPVVAPSLTLNGGTVSLMVPTQAIVHVLTDPNATLWFWNGSDCSGAGVNLNTSESYAAAYREATWSYRATRLDHPGLQSACLTITFTDRILTPIPNSTPTQVTGSTPPGSPTIPPCDAGAVVDPCPTPTATAHVVTVMPSATVSGVTIMPSATVSASLPQPVSGLPNTGTGPSKDGPGGAWILLLLATAVVGVSILRLGRSRR